MTKNKNKIQLYILIFNLIIMKNTIKSILIFLSKNLLTGFIIVLGWIIALLWVRAFESLTTTPADTWNQSLTSPMLTKDGWIFDRNYHSLEAIANALWLPSVWGWKKVFFTKTKYQWNLWWLAGADSICQTTANARSLWWTWKAVLSSSTVDAISRLTAAKTIFNLYWDVVTYNPLWKWLFELWKAKTNSSQYEIRWPLITDEYKTFYPSSAANYVNSTTVASGEGIYIWTNTSRDWIKLGNLCTDWTTTAWSFTRYFNWLINHANSFNWQDFFYQTTPAQTVSLRSNTGGWNSAYCDNYRSLLCQEQ